jgi:formylglycine-generating enzyme required for sulfatase activity
VKALGGSVLLAAVLPAAVVPAAVIQTAALRPELLQAAEAEPVARTREELKRADAALAGAESALVAAYEDFERVLASARSEPLPPRLAAAARSALLATRAEIAAGRLSAEPAGRSKVIADLRARAQQSLASLMEAPLAATVAVPLGDALLPEVASSGEPSEGLARACGTVASRWFDPAVPAHELWNRGIFRELAPAKDYARARAEQAAAADRLGRLEHPERYHPAYERTPEGMVFVVGGTFKVGGNDGYDLDTEKRKSVFEMQLRPFYIDRTEVTNRAYAEFLRGLSPKEAEPRTPSTWERSAGGGPGVMPAGAENLPATGVSYEDAAAFAAWAKKRLPTEDEWEAAARGPKALKYPWGNEYKIHSANDSNGEIGGPAAVGAFPDDTSWCGALDMAGNVMEWVATLDGGKPAPTKLETNVNVVLRGGAYDRDSKESSSVYRWLWPGKTTRVGNLGFRCAKDAY